MAKSERCKCKTGCNNRRCACLKYHEPCDPDCGCVGCQNPLDGVDIEGLTVCTLQHIELYKTITDEEFDEVYDLPCGHEPVALRKLVRDYSCEQCKGERYWFSFCAGECGRAALAAESPVSGPQDGAEIADGAGLARAVEEARQQREV